MLRQPIIAMMGNIDAGKTQLLDTIRQTTIVKSEPGKITQMIGCSMIPIETIKKICGNLLSNTRVDVSIPGLLAIDTPGHASFSSIRKRGGNLADITILVIDINEGVKPQTLECIDILRQFKTPFIVALNKLDLFPGWIKAEGTLLQKISKQPESVRQNIETRLYEIVGKLSELGFNSERFDRVSDYTSQIAIVPVSAVTSDGVPELLMVLTGMAQKFLEKNLECDIKGNAKGTVLELKEDKGLGTTVDVIIYDGCIKSGDTVVIGTLDEPIVTKIKAILEPLPLKEMRDKKSKFKATKEAYAASGIKISAPGLENAIAGMPLRVVSDNDDIEKIKEDIKKEVSEVIVETSKEGIIIKADSLGSLEALTKLLKENNISIRKASIGNISKKDILDAESIYEKDPLKSVVLGFNVIDNSGSKNENVKILTSDVIYRLIEDLEAWQKEILKKQQEREFDKLMKPCKIQLMKGYIFRQNNPAIVGVDVLQGTLKVGTALMKNDGNTITEVSSIQHEKKNVNSVEKGKQVAASLTKVTVGRQINEEDILFSSIPESDFRQMKKLKKLLDPEDIELLKEIAEIKRRANPVWGI